LKGRVPKIPDPRSLELPLSTPAGALAEKLVEGPVWLCAHAL
jgi:hypothetical protein